MHCIGWQGRWAPGDCQEQPGPESLCRPHFSSVDIRLTSLRAEEVRGVAPCLWEAEEAGLPFEDPGFPSPSSRREGCLKGATKEAPVVRPLLDWTLGFSP